MSPSSHAPPVHLGLPLHGSMVPTGTIPRGEAKDWPGQGDLDSAQGPALLLGALAVWPGGSRECSRAPATTPSLVSQPPSTVLSSSPKCMHFSSARLVPRQTEKMIF